MQIPEDKRELSRIVEFAEASAHADMFGVAPTEFGFELEDTPDYVARFAPGMDIMMFNRAVGLGLKSPANRSLVEGIVKRYRDKGITKFAIQLSPEALPAEIPEWLTDLGLGVRDYWTKAYMPANPDLDIPTDLRIEQIDRSHAEQFAATACAGFGMPESLMPVIGAPVGLPGWKHYIAWDGDIPAAIAALMIKGEVGWLGIGATRAEYRRRGAQGALIARRVRDGSREGCSMFVAETWKSLPDKPNPSFHNMLRTGFIVTYDRPNYMLTADG